MGRLESRPTVTHFISIGHSRLDQVQPLAFASAIRRDDAGAAGDRVVGGSRLQQDADAAGTGALCAPGQEVHRHDGRGAVDRVAPVFAL